jgi:GAF domain-containing protein
LATNTVAQRIDEMQFAMGEGPCLASYATGQPQSIADLAHEGRWMNFCREARLLGVSAIYCFPVSIGSQPIGVLELHRRENGELSVDEHEAALGCAAAIGAVISSTYSRWSERDVEDGDINGATLASLTQSDPFTRSEVHVAAGVIAQHLGVSLGEALIRMRAYAFGRNQRITDVAADVVDERIPLADW